MEYFLGFDIGGTKCAVVLGDREGHVLKKLRFETTDFESTLEQLLQSGDQLFCQEVVAIGVSCGGPHRLLPGQPPGYREPRPHPARPLC